MNSPDLPARLAEVRKEIARRQAAGGWSHPVTIVAVTKGFGIDAVRAAHAAGLAAVGENRVQEALAKMAEWPDAPLAWHLVGHLQRNKAKQAVGRFALIHSVDDAALGLELDKRAAAANTTVRCLLQVNVAREAQKSGCPPEEARPLARQLGSLPHLKLGGLMTIAPLTADQGVLRGVFRGLRELRDQIRGDGVQAPDLSMGMSGDFGLAVEEGATLVRLGTALFGNRPNG
ncbi:MAG: YggS family pyridoxal phosphate-dependent enzyme [Gemmatimonadales bacterium]